MARSRFLCVVFFISGFCGLLYQIVWLRLACAAFGIVTPVISVVVSVFMLGLSLGSWLGGKWVESMGHRTRRSALMYYGMIELMIGAGAFTVPKLFGVWQKMLLNVGAADGGTYLLLAGGAITVSLLPWCFFMGATIPVMMAFVREVQDSQSSFSLLYSANVLGSACGVGVTAMALIEILGFSSTLYVAAALNAGIAVTCFLMAREPTQKKGAEATAPVKLGERTPTAPVTGTALAVTILFIGGFVSVALEVVWTRAFLWVLKTTTYAFAVLLVIYLLATWFGSMVYRRHLRLNTVMPIGKVLGYLSVSAFLPIFSSDPRFAPHPLVACISVAPLCGLLGYLTPRLIDECSFGRPDLAGKYYAVNVVGCILGPLVAGYFLLPTQGVKHSMIFLALPFMAMFALTMRTWTRNRVQKVLCAVGSTLMLVVSTRWSMTLESEELYPHAVVRRDHTATVMSACEGIERKLFVNGVGVTHLTTVTKLMAHWPILHLPAKPKNVLILCLGMGTTFRSAMQWDTEVYAVELVPSVRDAFGFYHEDAPRLLQNPKGHVVIDDGRRFLMRTPIKFDVITIDPSPPVEAAGSSLLYSNECYELIKSRLSEDGIVQQWFPGGERAIGEAVARSIAQSFPYVRAFISLKGSGTHYLASMKPIPPRSMDELLARTPSPVLADLNEWLRPNQDAGQAYEKMLSSERTVPHESAGLGITDDRPFNEYFLLRRLFYHEPPSWSVLVVIISVGAVILALIVLRPRRTAFANSE